MDVKDIKIGRSYTNVTRPQIVKVTHVNHVRVEYQVIKATTDNPIDYFVVSPQRFANLYHS